MLFKSRKNKYKRESGVLLHIASLPSNFGIGTFGREAYNFIDFLKQNNQSYWQILPLCPIGNDNSPFNTYSTFAGKILFIDIETLINEGCLKLKIFQVAIL